MSSILADSVHLVNCWRIYQVAMPTQPENVSDLCTVVSAGGGVGGDGGVWPHKCCSMARSSR